MIGKVVSAGASEHDGYESSVLTSLSESGSSLTATHWVSAAYSNGGGETPVADECGEYRLGATLSKVVALSSEAERSSFAEYTGQRKLLAMLLAAACW